MILLMVALFFCPVEFVHASVNDGNVNLTTVSDFANGQLNTVVSNLVKDGEISNNDNVYLAEPYYIYNELEDQEAIYYFPIVKDQTIVSVMCVLDSEDGLVYQYGDEIKDKLNEIHYLQEKPLIYEEDGKIHIEGRDELLTVSTSEEVGEIVPCKKFSELSYSNKKKRIEEKMDDLVPCVHGEKPENILDLKIKGLLSLHNPQGQHGYDMCWAAAVATVVNYKKSSMVTGFDVCNRMGIGYNTGGTIYQEHQALSLYGVTYNGISGTSLDWNTIKNNINNNHPIIANLMSNSGTYKAHAVTIYGFDSSKNLNYWDSRLGGGSGAYKKTSFNNATFLSIDGHSYYWGTSLYKQ